MQRIYLAIIARKEAILCCKLIKSFIKRASQVGINELFTFQIPITYFLLLFEV